MSVEDFIVRRYRVPYRHRLTPVAFCLVQMVGRVERLPRCSATPNSTRAQGDPRAQIAFVTKNETRGFLMTFGLRIASSTMKQSGALSGSGMMAYCCFRRD